jgi:hypothetical protein
MVVNLLVSLGLSALVITVGFIILNKRIERTLNLDKTLGKVRDEVGGLIRDLNQTTERNIIIIEERVVRLKELLGHADRQLEILQREAERRENSLKTYSHLRKVVVPEQELPFREPVPATIVTEQDGPVKSDRAAMRKKVLELHRQGITPDMIAEKMEIPRGEVELIISVFQR